VTRGDALFATGDVASARLLYEFAADSGEARAAVRLGETFDPAFLGNPRLRGVSGDLGMALFWYRRARDLGATEVELRLKALETKQGG
jgi:TPR repeat protein